MSFSDHVKDIDDEGAEALGFANAKEAKAAAAARDKELAA